MVRLFMGALLAPEIDKSLNTNLFWLKHWVSFGVMA
jgi:hypothetical protein